MDYQTRSVVREIVRLAKFSDEMAIKAETSNDIREVRRYWTACETAWGEAVKLCLSLPKIAPK